MNQALRSEFAEEITRLQDALVKEKQKNIALMTENSNLLNNQLEEKLQSQIDNLLTSLDDNQKRAIEAESRAEKSEESVASALSKLNKERIEFTE